MRAATALAGSLMLVLATAPAPTIGQDDDGWPTPAELRQELADDGWEWAARSSFWTGGRGGPVVFLGLTSPLYVAVTVDDLWGYGLLSWTEQTRMSWTAFLEIAERLPVDDATLEAVIEELDGAACHDHPLPGGMLTVDGPGRDEVSHTQVKRIMVVQDGETRCDRPPVTDEPVTDEPVTDEPASESPAA